MKLVFQTYEHDFYRTFYTGKEANIYNIVKSGAPIPTTGYLLPAYILKIKGYSNLKVFQVFT